MSRFKNTVDQQKAHINTLRAALVGVVIICAAFWYGWKSAPNTLTVHVPPDLRSGSTRLWWDVPPENVYSFALYIFQQLNRWPNSGDKDYSKAIYSLQNYLTPSCKAELEEDHRSRQMRGELQKRVRGVYEILGRGYVDKPTFRVQQSSQNSWLVNLDLNADEYFLTEQVKRSVARYPVKIVRYDIDPSKNPYGLALDCFSGQIQRITIDGEQNE